MYSLILSHKSDLKAELAAYLKKDAELAGSAAALEIKKLNNRLNFAENYGKDKKLSGIFKNILVQKNSGIKITFFLMKKAQNKTIKIKFSCPARQKKRRPDYFRKPVEERIESQRSYFSRFQFNKGKRFRFFFDFIYSK